MDNRIVFLALALILTAIFIWRMGKERRDVRNRGVNESALVSALRALGYLLSRTITYGAALYLLASVYFMIAFRADCQGDSARRRSYERASLIEHVAEALTWPLYWDAEPPCER